MQWHLILDFGNTKLKAALFFNDELKEQHILASTQSQDILALVKGKSISACILASVRLDDEGLEAKLQTFFPTLRLGSQTALPIQNLYRTPATLGYDRLAAAVAGWQLFPGQPVLAIVAGTCITYNLITADGKFLGGAISPGLVMRAKAMHAFTQRLPEVELDGPVEFPGYDTITSLRSGVILATQAELKGMRQAVSSNYPDLVTIIGGGDTSRLANDSKNGIFARPFLVQEGLNSILNYQIANHLL